MPALLASIRKQLSAIRNRSQRSARTKKHRQLQFEALESRELLSAVVGTVYDDTDANGTRNNGENGVSGWTVYLDLDNSGTFNNAADGTPEPSAVTNKDGDFTIRNVKAGNYRVAEVVQAGWRPTAPATRDITVTAGTDTRADFFNFAGGTITGVAWNDLNGDGIRDTDPATGEFTEPGLGGWTIYLDLNQDAVLNADEPQTTTDSTGAYEFTEVPAGDYEVTEVMPDGWEPTKGYDIHQTASVNSLQTTVLDFANFSFTNGSIDGVLWNDLNGDGDRQIDPSTGKPTEPGLAGWTVFLDENYNGIPDAGEPSVISDENGHYTFPSVTAGTYAVTEYLPSEAWSLAPGYSNPLSVDVFAGERTGGVDFGNFTILNGEISGLIWNDLNRDGVRNTDLSGSYLEPGLSEWSVFLDINRNGAPDDGEPVAVTDSAGQYFFSDLQIGEYDLIEVVPAGWETAPGYGDNQSVRVYSGSTTSANDFANFNVSTLAPGTVTGSVWNDANGNGIQDVDPAAEPGLSGWSVFADLNFNGIADPAEPQTITGPDGSYAISGINPGTVSIRVLIPVGWTGTSPSSGVYSFTLRNGETAAGKSFGAQQIHSAEINGLAFADSNRNGVQDAGEKGLAGITIYLDINKNAILDAGEPSKTTQSDQFFTPSVNESGTFSFSHLADGVYDVRQILPVELSATPVDQLLRQVVVASTLPPAYVSFADLFRANEIHGTKFDDVNHNGIREADEPTVAGSTIFIDLNRNSQRDTDEPTTTTDASGAYSFIGLTPGAYVVREEIEPGRTISAPGTKGGILWPSGTSNSPVGIVSPTGISISLGEGESFRQTFSITLPNTGGLTNMVDVFLLFDDTGSFVNNSPIVRGAFPEIIAQLQASLPGIDLGYGVGRFEEYGNFAYEYSTGRPFVLNQPIVASSTTGYMAAIQAALDRETPGYGGDGPETDIEALYQLVTGLGFDGNNNGSVLDSGFAGLASTQLTPGDSGDVPSFASFRADPTQGVLAADGTVGGAGFRSGALPVVLLATDIGFAYQPKGEITIQGVGGTTVPVSRLTDASRPTTPFDHGAGLQETVTALNALGALVIGLGTNPEFDLAPRQSLEALSLLTGAINQSSSTIENGTADAIAPGDPLYFEIASGFSTSVSNGVVNAIQNAVTNVAVNITVKASDPRVRIINHSGTRNGMKAGDTANFDIEFTGDGIPHRFDLQFVREGSDVVLGSIPVVIGTPIPGDGYHFDDLEDGEIELESHFGDYGSSSPQPNTAPGFVSGGSQTSAEDSGTQTVTNWASSITKGSSTDESWQSLTFMVTTDHPELFSTQPAISEDGTLTWTSALNAHGTAAVTVVLKDNGGTANGGVDTSDPQFFQITISAVNDAPTATDDNYSLSEDAVLEQPASGVLVNDNDVDGDALTALLAAAPSHGVVVLNVDGSFIYTPNQNYNGADSFTYQVFDGAAYSGEATVTLTIQPTNDAPVANSDSYSLLEDQTLNVVPPGVLTNDEDVDGDSLSAKLVNGPAHGTLNLNADGSFTYTPNQNYNGADSFTYQVFDGAAYSGEATVTLTIQPTNDAPVANSDSYSLLEDQTLNVVPPGVLTNDEDVDGDSLTAKLVNGPAHGTLNLNADGSFTYTPTSNYFGPDSFTYQVSDGTVLSDVATVYLTIESVNDAPVVKDDFYSTETDKTLIVPVSGVLANDNDVEQDPLQAVLVSAPLHGQVTLNSDGSFTYVPNPGYAGDDTFSYKAFDGTDESGVAIVTITVNPIQPPPAGDIQFHVVDSGSRRTFTYDADGNLSGSSRLNKEDDAPRGISVNADGSMAWVIDDKGEVFVYDNLGMLLGSWKVKGIDKPEGITVSGADLLIVDRSNQKVYTFLDGATRVSGKQSPSGSFSLDRSNRNARDLATDGIHVWIVDDGATEDKVFRYTISGNLDGTWSAGSVTAHSTGIAVDPENSDVWLVDSQSDRAYRFSGGMTATSGQLPSSGAFNLNSQDRNPQGLSISHKTVSGGFAASRAFGGSSGNGSSLLSLLTQDPSSPQSANDDSNSTEKYSGFGGTGRKQNSYLQDQSENNWGGNSLPGQPASNLFDESDELSLIDGVFSDLGVL